MAEPTDALMNFAARQAIYRQIEQSRATKVLSFITGDRPGVETQIAHDARRLFVALLDQIGPTARISLLLDTNGGSVSDSGSHDYTINRREAQALGLTVEKPSQQLYERLREIAASYTDEMKVLEPYSPSVMLGAQQNLAYTLVRGLIESTEGGCYGFVSEGVLIETQPAPQRSISDQRTFEGWRKLS